MRILVIGDAMQDEYLLGTTTRLSPEAPVPIVSVTRTEKRPGGAANVAANIEAMGVPCERIFGGGERIRKLRLISGHQHVARIDFDYPQEPIRADAAYLEAVERCTLVVAIDYGKGALTEIAALIDACSKPVLVDPKGHDYARYRGAALLKPNAGEMRELVGGWGSQEELDYKARQVLHVSAVGAILLTQAADGMTLYTPSSTQRAEAQNKAPVDVSGAGEAALAAYAAAFAQGFELGSCLRFAARAAGIAISRQGTTVCTEEEVFGTG